MMPPWVYDLIAAVQEHEDTHGTDGECLGKALEKVPEKERDRAAAIRAYLVETNPPQNKTPWDEEPPF